MKNRMVWSIMHGLLLVVLFSYAGATKFCSWYTNNVPLECQRNEFRCLNGKNCISRNMYCNGVDNCGDNSDETYCRVIRCPENFIICSSSWDGVIKCVPEKWKCDGYNDCSNGDDERNCRREVYKVSLTPETETVSAPNRTAADKVQRWINGQKNEQSSGEKWGSNVGRLALILYLINEVPTFKGLFLNQTEMAYEVSIQLLSQLANTKLGDIPSEDLASYVNAFLVTCVNPRKFHGHDIIKELRKRADQDNYTNPYVFLALCNAGETITDSDKSKLIDIFEKKHRKFWADMQAVVVMALACANKQQNNEVDSETLRDMAQELKQQQFRNGTIVNLPTTALVMQALISINSENDPDNFDEARAFQELLRNQKYDGSFGDVMNTLLAAPVLTCRSLVDINSTHCQFESTDESSALENLSRRRGPKIRVQYSLWIGNDKDLERNLVLRLPENTSLYSAMETAADIDSRFKFEYSVKDRKPYINAVSGMGDNPLTGKFWFLYVIQDEKPVLSNKSPADVVPKDNDHFVMWYRRGTWVD